MDPNLQLLAGLHVAVGPDGRLYLVSLPPSQTAAPTEQPGQHAAQSVVSQALPLHQLPGMSVPTEVAPDVNPGMTNLSALLSQALLSQSLGNMPVSPVTESSSQVLQQYLQMMQHQQSPTDIRVGENNMAVAGPMALFEGAPQVVLNDPTATQTNLLHLPAAQMMNAGSAGAAAMNPLLFQLPSATTHPLHRQAMDDRFQPTGQNATGVFDQPGASVFQSASAVARASLPVASAATPVHPTSQPLPVSSLPASQPQQHKGVVPNRPPTVIAMPCDAQNLSPYQRLAREQIEIFQALPSDVEANAQGRNRPIVPGQVGIRCKHCAHLPHKQRKSGAVYFPSKVRFNERVPLLE